MSKNGIKDDDLGFAAAHDVPVPYMQRLRDYYLALGYGNPYRWAQYTEVPFTPLAKPLNKSKVGLVVTAAPYQPDKGNQGPGAAYNASAKFYRVYSGQAGSEPDVRISHLGYDRKYNYRRRSSQLFSPWRSCKSPPGTAVSAHWRRAFMAPPPTAASRPRWIRIAWRPCNVYGRTGPKRRSLSRLDRYAIRP